MTNHTSIEDTINNCDKLIEFQKLVKLSSKYEYVEHNGIKYNYKCYRVFASTSAKDGRILKGRNGDNPAKFGNTPDKCFIENGDVHDIPIPAKLDRQYYIDLAKKRLADFGIKNPQ
jgi:DNA polymerase